MGPQSRSSRMSYRISRFKSTHTLYILLLSSLALLQFIAIAFFAKGFLLTRTVLDNVAEIDPNLKYGPKYDKMVLLIVDALRFDFVIPVDENHPKYNPYYHNNLKVLHETSHNSTDSVLLKFLADPPTTTLQRLKGLTTGSLPTFIDAGSNFNGDVIEEDNLIKQLYLHDKKVFFAGDDTWDALFGPYLAAESVPYESLNVWDLDTVDNGVISFFEEYYVNEQRRSEYDVLIGHMLGVDHVGHKYGPNHFTMREKQLQVDELLRKIISTADDNTLYVVMGDHGMDHTGNHGGDSQDELESTLWLYAKDANWSKDDLYNTTNLGSSYKTMNQIDLVPTLSLLLGLPIPFNNLGWPLDEIAKDPEELAFYHEVCRNQLENYLSVSNIIGATAKRDALVSVESHTEFQKMFLEICKDLWARFDFTSICVGIAFMTFSLILLLIVIKLIPSIVVGQMVGDFVGCVVVLSGISNVSFQGIYQVLHQPAFLDNYIWCSAFATAVGIILGVLIPIFDRYSVQWLCLRLIEELSDYWSRIALLFIVIHALLFTSNSFTIWEDRIVAFLLTSFGMLALYEFTFLPQRHSTAAILSGAGEKQGTLSGKSVGESNSDSLPLGRFARILGGYHSIVLVLFTRLSSMITICREEQGEYCTPTFTVSNNYSYYTMLGCLILVPGIPSCIKGYFNVCSSYQAAAPIWIGFILKASLFASFLYWSLLTIENRFEDLDWDLTIWKYTISRIVAGMSLIGCNIGWMKGPLCVKLNIHNTDMKSQQATILGYSNVYGSQYFLLVLNFLMAIMLFNKPLGQLSIFLMCNQLLSIIEICDLLKLKESVIGPVALGLLAYQQFFSTGHQATIPSVQWDMGFILTEKIIFPWTHLGIVLNTFGPFILVALSVALLTLWKQPPAVLQPQTILARIVSNCGTLLIYNSVLCLSSFVWVTHFRRHLMVWKIFCPRFLFASLCLIVSQLVVTFITIGFASSRLIRQISQLFSK
ncbi:unnamed protein product [Kluyveromyces dobzhanskii CBS 2104]|uniref:WGS project CCBQ000000000 data, contig 00009 n=1 Tax=Kluyveromyces dobzhanskii CBS 2104 TaxID=1427455 RepID=A0A0A8L514_9SACH|nr:unnamed protein product [Kluyveromyces dobzhanskii CBS 2104]